MTDLGALTAGDFEPLLYQRFGFASDATMPFEVELIGVSETGSPGPSRSQFSLVFRGGPSPPLPQGIYRVENAGVGAIEIFLVPIAADRYEAVFT